MFRWLKTIFRGWRRTEAFGGGASSPGEGPPAAGEDASGASGAAAAGRGRAGEDLAARWLQRERGMRIVARNWRNPADRREELDLVARDGDALVFVEVKTRVAGSLVGGYEAAVSARKKRVVRRAATAYLRALGQPVRTFRYDVVEVEWPRASGDVDDGRAEPPASGGRTGGEPVVRHFEAVRLWSKHFRG